MRYPRCSGRVSPLMAQDSRPGGGRWRNVRHPIRADISRDIARAISPGVGGDVTAKFVADDCRITPGVFLTFNSVRLASVATKNSGRAARGGGWI